MAKASNTINVRTRAIKAWMKAMEMPDYLLLSLNVRKSRSKDTITVSTKTGDYAATWSYKGGSLRRINA